MMSIYWLFWKVKILILKVKELKKNSQKARNIDYKSLSNSKTVKWLATGKITLNILKIKQDPKIDFHPPQNLLYKQPLYQSFLKTFFNVVRSVFQISKKFIDPTCMNLAYHSKTGINLNIIWGNSLVTCNTYLVINHFW